MLAAIYQSIFRPSAFYQNPKGQAPIHKRVMRNTTRGRGSELKL